MGRFVLNDLINAASSFRDALWRFDPQIVSAAECAEIAESLAATEKACAAVRLIASDRAVAGGAHAERGFKDGASWMARHCGSTSSQARQALETAKKLEDCPRTKEALLSGDVSVAQAQEITRAEADTPGAERHLLKVARKSDLSKLRDEARDHKAANTGVSELHRQQHRARYFRHWRDRLGMVCFTGALPPTKGLPFIHRLEAETSRLHDEAKRMHGVKKSEGGSDLESFDAHAADAFCEMVSGKGKAVSDRADLVIVCDIYAYRRGHAHQGEPCRILDGGPIPVDVAKELTTDAFLKAVLHDGTQIHTVRHFGRHLPAVLRTALDMGPVPGFSGAKCIDCGSGFGLQYDHVNPVANMGPTEYTNLKARCWRDHQEKTERDRKAGLLGRDARKRSP